MAVLDTARKILLLEQKEGFRDRAVVGGLDLFLEQVQLTALPTLAEPEQRQLSQVLEPLTGYSSAPPEDRKAMLEVALARIATQSRAGLEGPTGAGSEPAPADERVGAGFKPVQSPTPNKKGGFETRPYKGSMPTRRALADKRRAPTVMAEELDTPLERIPGIGTALLPRLKKLGLQTARDMLYMFPVRHMDRSSFAPIAHLRPGQEETVMGTIWEIRNERTRRGLVKTTLLLTDRSGSIAATWFNQPYLVRTLHPHAEVVLSGKVELFMGRPQLSSPEWELVTENDLLHTGRIVPVYRLTEGLRPKAMRTLMKRAVDTYAPALPEFLPESIRREANLMGLAEAVEEYHFPETWSTRAEAERRLAFDELFLIQLTVLQKRRFWQESQPGIAMRFDRDWLEALILRLPFKLTGAQRKALEDALADLQSGRPMNRLIEGDVGSGKTVVAALAMLAAVESGYQAVLMAPTEILGEQHYNSITRLFDQLNGDRFQGPPRVVLLTGNVKGKQRRETLEALKNGSASIAVGTHALIQEGVEFERLGLAIIDEQHRFGVEQRSTLRQKGFNPHVLVMTATPIPRSLGLMIYGDLDISVIDEMPPGRQPIKTRWFSPEERRRAYEFIRGQVKEGRQAFIICPLIEESESMEVRAATAEYERLRRLVFPEFSLGLLHGKLKNREKDAVMAAFARNEMQILVSTSVVEVGIDVPNATVMAIEGAERFGLAQLHQFRGRVGRGEYQSYCILLSDSPDAALNPRLKAIEETHSGFRLAEIDLELRGYGDLFGTRQSGLPNLKVAKLTDVELIETSRRLAGQLLDRDPDLGRHGLLRQQLVNFWHEAEVS